MSRTKKLPPATQAMIPLDKLVLSERNVRKILKESTIESLAQSIAHVGGLLQSLSVRAVLDGEGNETGMYEVQAGGRRYRALQLLVKRGLVAKTAPIPCLVRSTGYAEVDSLVENSEREALHPLDQFRAFAQLAEKGMPVEDIAAAFAVSSLVVKQRLKLMSVSPVLLGAYQKEEMTLEQLMAFAVSDDHARQEAVWDGLSSWDKTPRTIRRKLNEHAVPANDRRVIFVSLEAYEAAGGFIARDLFDEESQGYLQDADLLNRLVEEKLASAAQTFRNDGWSWVVASTEFAYGHTRDYRPIRAIEPALNEAETQELDRLRDELDELTNGTDEEDDLDQDARARYDALNARIGELEAKRPVYSPEDKARAGVFLSLDYEGNLAIDEGWARPQDIATAPVAGDRPILEPSEDMGEEPSAFGCGSPPPQAAQEDDIGPAIPERLKTELTAHRTLALRYALSLDPVTAHLAALHAIARRLFYRWGAESCLQITASDSLIPPFPGLKDTPFARALEAAHKAWAERLPEEPSALWHRLKALTPEERTDLFAHCVAMSVNAVYQPHAHDKSSVEAGDHLASELALDMSALGWITTAENYFKRVTKVAIIDAVREAKGDATADLLLELKKGDMATEAERLVRETDWLPPFLRTASLTEPETDAGADDLPAFLDEAAREAA